MLKIGITGPMGSGKTYCAKQFEKLGIQIFYSDDIAKKLMNDVLPLKMSISKEFGKVYNSNGELDAKLLKEKVFSKNSGDKIDKLNLIVHPYVFKEYEKFCSDNFFERYTLIESAILYECGLDKNLDDVIYVDANPDVRIGRAFSRSGIKKKEYIERMKSQISPEIKLAKSYYTIFNNPFSKNLEEQILEIHNFII